MPMSPDVMVRRSFNEVRRTWMHKFNLNEEQVANIIETACRGVQEYQDGNWPPACALMCSMFELALVASATATDKATIDRMFAEQWPHVYEMAQRFNAEHVDSLETIIARGGNLVSLDS